MNHDFLIRCRKRADNARFIAGTSIKSTELASYLALNAADMDLLLEGIHELKDKNRELRAVIEQQRRDLQSSEARVAKMALLASKHRSAASMISSKHEALEGKILKRDRLILELRMSLDEAIRLLEVKHGTA